MRENKRKYIRENKEGMGREEGKRRKKKKNYGEKI